MDEKNQVLVGIGAAVAAKCEKCFGFLLDKAKKLGVEEKDINATVLIAKQVIKGANNSMDQFITSQLDITRKILSSGLNKECGCSQQ
ncbi:MAG: carboxymuconolactone decarboxylase family protein [Candidatus Hermodarchaeota archaeon]